MELKSMREGTSEGPEVAAACCKVTLLAKARAL
jgi:hypothetical protein